MGETPDQLKSDIAGTRADMTATLDAITNRASPKAMAGRQVGRVRGRLVGVRDAVMGSAGEVSDRVSGTAAGLTDTVSGTAAGAGDQLRQGPAVVKGHTRGNPMAAGLIAFGAGLLVASMAPASEAEKRAAGSVTEQAQPLVDHVKQAGQEVAGQLQSSASEAAGQVKESAAEAADQVRQQAREATGHVADTAKGAASEVKNTATDQNG